MARRLNYETVKKVFRDASCTLLEKTYVNNYTKMRFTCKCGETGYKSLQGFKRHPSCEKCSKKNSLAQLRTPEKFSYDHVKSFIESKSDCKLLSTSYKNNAEKLSFECGCGNRFTTTFAKFKDRNKRQCNVCTETKMSKRFSHSYKDVKHFIEVESDSGCELLSTEYKNNSTPLKLQCACGESFEVTFNKFKSEDRRKRHCYSCSTKIRSEARKFSLEEVREIIEKRGCELVANTYTNAKTKMPIRCGCGEVFEAELHVFQRGQFRCGKCSGKQSQYELATEHYLIDSGYVYETEYVFEECRNIEPLPFDFVVFKDINKSEIDFLVEVDGQQHFAPSEFFGGEDAFRRQQERDKIKDDFCESNLMTLIRVPYYDVDNIENIFASYDL